ncbi:NAD(P)-dependent alcohol dehydrogenase [Pseudomonas aeruginosa]|uniref:NAD(P)-dependent alcohol dehydrogenase n=1 Tax=Pseudomonas TaxID=286 RepID=UPI0003BB0889|nr:NAD(P)-dependent alcohol dehydrogenase [Pseudomonas aeruginosa]EIY2735609.1 NAD(P)-dependent alcohol dehydrogenase [Pseudomonas aeruginosa]ERX57433.1 alcohol dehydrogenase [Pseudomonas aeruginosa X24509]KAA5557728.1 NAD(P)-dependent alcohol dehydrogenase [Pseudomonas aeruginosa]KAA5564274.1 NAD(P)-dependent alcohol dehydrogenase [Pseudomonas aeruginosa]KAA5689080.1 NAD(P)-dependent alcohol dehydrogenase [Pseudomonas aeruginosa]
MTLQIRGYAAQSASTPLTAHRFERRAPRADDLVIDILYCGVCHSDLHQARNEWHNSLYPLVPGHEIIGRVASVGEAVSGFAVGELVGVGCMVDSCRHCAACSEGLEQYCAEYPTLTYNGRDRHDGLPTFGGYSERIVVSARFVLRIPQGLDPKAAAPLLCAGITSYSPLRHWKIGPGSRVAVVGLGGLGHMGLKFARALGAEVALFTRSPGKEEEARRLGADQVILSTDPQRMAAVAGRFDLILDTVPHQHDLNPYLATLKRDGTLVLVGLLEPLEPAVHGAQLVMGRRSIAGSAIGGIAETQEMLDFCAAHGIACDIEMIEIQQINQAYERMLASDVKYRFVIDMASLQKSF